jgi:uncharacterized protein YidB (DUF937 family)
MSIGAIGSNFNDQQWNSQQVQQLRQPPALTNTAQLLGVSTSQLSSDLQSGQTLSSLASSAGVSSSDLLSAVETDMQANAPSGAPAPSSSQLQEMATDFINGSVPRSSGSSSTASSNLGALASATGMSASELLSELSSGSDLSELFGSPGATGYGSTIAQQTTGGVLLDEYA